jgi:2-polyprenyl-3-methyl-5-hydroxy-6-metoxy-1,4-benzoquinol methylase
MSKDCYSCYTSTQALADSEKSDQYLRWSSAYFKSNFMPILPVQKDALILDVACGYGRHLTSLRGMGYSNCIGVDISPKQIQYARNELKLNNVEEADIFSWLALNKSKYDCILVIDFLEHLNNDDLINLMMKLRSILNTQGRLIIQAPNGISLINPIIHGDLTHVRAFTPESLRQLFLLSGFSPPFTFHEALPPQRFNMINIIKRIVWKLILRPLIDFMVTMTHHRMEHKIYTNNIIAVTYNHKGSMNHEES